MFDSNRKFDLLVPSIIFIYLIIYTSPLLGQPPSSGLQKEILKIINAETNISIDQHIGFAVSVIDHDSTWNFSFGQHAISPWDIFQIGGLTKVFTSDLCYRLVEIGAIDLHMKVGECLTELQKNPDVNRLTFSQLLDHTSGLPGLPENLGANPPGNGGRYVEYRKKDLLQFLMDYTPSSRSNIYQYSHLNYALIEILLECLTGSDWETLMSNYLWQVDSMFHSGSTDTGQFIPTNGFDRSGKNVAPWAFESFRGSEGMFSCLNDLSHYVYLLINNETSRSRLNEMTKTTRQVKVQGNIFSAHGWHVIRRGKKPAIFLHSGKTDGHAASIHLIPKTRTAVIILTKSPSSLDGLAMHILRMINFNWKRKS